ncbi:uncharacterized protein [Lolium perenne]|uniref:uncharacterized protein n=1 Tax=Lolium perenne TaxID=4522 RepID=UPI003A9A226A
MGVLKEASSETIVPGSNSGDNQSTPPPPPGYVNPRDRTKQRKTDISENELAKLAASLEEDRRAQWATLGWNGRGVGQAATVQGLVCLVQTYKTILVFICETRQSKERVENLRYRIGMKHCYQVSGDGKGGGIALYWTEDVIADLLSFSKRHIDVHISGGPYNHMWRATFVYGEPKPVDRHLMWTKLRQIKDKSNKPWLMMGDFNEAMWQEEQFSRTPRSERLMMDFREVLSHCDLYDIGFVGNPCTFDNKQKGDRNVRVRLDRVVSSRAWSLMFPDHRLRHIASSRSDHCPILMSIESATNCRSDRPVRRYEIVWEREPSLPAAVEEA